VSKLSHPDELVDTTGGLSPGQVLQQAREQQGITLAQVSDRIKISATQLSAIEQGDLQQLPGLAYARGYVRTYGRFLGLDADALVQDFNALYGAAAQRQVKTINRVKPQAHLGDPIIRASIIVFVLLLLSSSVWWWQTQLGGTASLAGALSAVSSAWVAPNAVDTPSEVSPNSVDQVVNEPPVNLQEAEPVGAEVEPEYLTDAEIARLAGELEAEDTASVPDERVAVEETLMTNNGEDSLGLESAVLVIRFNGECWVSIKDTSGKVIYASLMQDGNTLERNLDTLPVELLIGQVGSVVESEFRGQLLDLAPHSKKGVARLTLQ
jgi:cytoskeleton protein RodZ